MKKLGIRINATLGVLAAATWIGAIACSSSEDPAPSGGGACTGAALEIYYPNMYSAFDGTHTFEIPAIVKGVSNASVVWSAEPSNLVALEQRPDLVMIRTLGAGNVTIKAASSDGTRCGSAPLTIAQVSTADWEAGNARYNNGVKLPPVNTSNIPMDGSNFLEAGGVHPACTNCHGESAMGGIFNGVTHTPMQTGGFTDDQLIQVMKAGVIPPGGYFNDAVISRTIWQFFHKWTLSDVEARGLVVYLRSLTPKSAGGSVDFSGINRGTGGTGGTGAGGTGGAAGTAGTGTGGTAGTGTAGTAGTGGTATGGTAGSSGTGGTGGTAGSSGAAGTGGTAGGT